MAGCMFSALVQATVSIEPYAAQEFNPTKGKAFELPVKITAPGKLAVSFYTSDGDLLRTVSTCLLYTSPSPRDA